MQHLKYLVLGLGFATVILFSQQAEAHKYASHSFDARVRGNTIDVDFSIDTISALEFIRKKHPSVGAFDRAAARAYRDGVYKHLNGQFSIHNNGKLCHSSDAFNFIYTPKTDRYLIQFILTCDQPVEEMKIKSGVFLDQSGLNTTIATIISPKGAQRYAFTRGATVTTINVKDLTGTPKKVTALMRNYDPLHGFKTKKAQMAALGIKYTGDAIKGDSTKKNGLKVTGKRSVPQKTNVFITALILTITAYDLLLFLLLMVVSVASLKEGLLAVAVFSGVFLVGEILSAAGLIEVSAVMMWGLVALPPVALAAVAFTKYAASMRLRIVAVAGLLNGIFAGTSFVGLQEQEMSGNAALLNSGGALAAALAAAGVLLFIANMVAGKLNFRESKKTKWLLVFGALLATALFVLRLFLS